MYFGQFFSKHCLIAVIFEEAADEDDEDADFTAFLTQPLARAPAGGVHNGTQLMVVDFSQVCLPLHVTMGNCLMYVFSMNSRDVLFVYGWNPLHVVLIECHNWDSLPCRPSVLIW